MSIVGRSFPEMMIKILNGAELGGATGAMAPLVFWSRSIKKSRKVSKSKSRSFEWHQLFLPSFGANENSILLALLCRTAVQEKIMKSSFTKESLAYSTNHLTP